MADDDIWKDDLLDRRADAEFIVSFLRNRIAERTKQGATGSYVLNLDSAWGQGKTFFLTRLQRQLKEAGHVAVYVDAWRDDHADDPMLAVMSAVDVAITPFLRKKKALQTAWVVTKRAGVKIAISAAKHGMKTAGKRLIGEGVDEIANLVAQEANSQASTDGESPNIAHEVVEIGVDAIVDQVAEIALQRFRDEQASIDNFRARLQALLVDIGNKISVELPLFILIDELDRCRPTYSIKLLERVKHLFDVPNVAFVIATDSGQLRHSINAVYGGSFDSAAYLRRFFNRTYKFEPATIDKFVSQEISRTKFPIDKFEIPFGNKLEQFLIDGAKFFNLSLRDVSQCIDLAHTVGTVWNLPIKIQLCYLFPLIVCFQQSDDRLWNTIIEGNNVEIERISDGKFDWSLSTPDSNSRNGRSMVKVFGIVSVISQWIKKDLIENSNRGTPTNQSGRLVSNILFDELNHVSQNAERRGPPMSIMTRYPEFIRNAGRLIMEDGRGLVST